MRNLTRTLSNSVTSTKLRKDNILRPYVVSVKNKVQEKIQFLFEMHKVQFASVISDCIPEVSYSNKGKVPKTRYSWNVPISSSVSRCWWE